MNGSTGLAAAICVLAMGCAQPAAAADETAKSTTAAAPAGNALMSTDEKADFKKRMGEAATLEQCKAIFAEHHKLVEQRSADRTANQKSRMAMDEGGDSCKMGSGGGGSGCCKGKGQGGHAGHGG